MTERDAPMTGRGLLDVVRQAITDLEAEHRPITSPADVGPRGGCVMCWPKQGSWPCVSRMVADDLAAALRRHVRTRAAGVAGADE